MTPPLSGGTSHTPMVSGVPNTDSYNESWSKHWQHGGDP